MKVRKAQTAMEFLMTYGWAILIVIAVVAALYAMGVFNLRGGGPGCSPCFPGGAALTYLDHTATTLKLRVGPSELSGVTVTNETNDAATTTYAPGTTTGVSGSDITFTLSDGGFTGVNDIKVTYTLVSSGLQHEITATLNGA